MGSFFIRRPIVAMVISIVMVIMGAVAITRLPIAQFPEITPPLIQVTTTYTGASALDVESSVAAPVEQQVNGVDNMIYMKSTNANDGTYNLQVSFEVGADLDMSNVLVQNRVSQASASLPPDVKTYGVTVKKSLNFPLMLVTLTSPSGAFDNNFLSNYAVININDQLKRISGVGDIVLFGGSDYAMRIWVRPDRLKTLGLTVADLSNAVKQQNVLLPAGQIGGPPAPKGTEFTYVVRTKGRLLDAEEFGQVVVRSNPDGSQVRLKDVARIELGSVLYNSQGRLDGKPAAVIAVYQAPGSNALAVSDAVKKTADEIATRFPPGVKHQITLDTTLAITAGIEEILSTLLEAVLLVILVVFVFLQNWRATLIPLLTVPVALIGTFMIFPLLGFSVNTLSLLGLVLAIGIVVDDAIVVVEAVMHHIEQGMSPKAATEQAMKEVSGPVIAIALVLTAVFVPVAFISGISGQLYQQFAITIAVSVMFSAVNALTLSPALASLLLKPKGGKRSFLQPFYDGFNKVFDRFTGGYMSITTILVRKLFRSAVLVGVFAVLAVVIAGRIPGGFIPDEDNGYFLAAVQLPDASSLERTDAVTRKVEQILMRNPAVAYTTTIAGYSMLSGAYASNTGFFFVSMKPWEERKAKEHRVFEVMRALNAEFAREIPEATAFAFGPPPIPGLGTGSGLLLHAPGPERRDARVPGRQPRQVHGGGEEAPRDRHGQLHLPRGRPADLRRRGPGQGAEGGRPAHRRAHHHGVVPGRQLHQRLQPLRARLQGVPPGRAGIPDQGAGPRALLRPRAQGRHDPARHPHVHEPDLRPRVHQPLQPLPLRGGDRHPGPRLQLGPGHEGARGGRRRGPAQGHGLPVVERVVPGEEGRGHGRHRLRLRHDHGVPHPGGPVRELVPADERAAGHALRRLRRLPRPVAGPLHQRQLREQHLRPDRPHHAGGAGRQERHPHRRVRQDERREGHGAGGGRARTRPGCGCAPSS